MCAYMAIRKNIFFDKVVVEATHYLVMSRMIIWYPVETRTRLNENDCAFLSYYSHDQLRLGMP